MAEVITTIAAAERLGVTRRRVLQYIAEGRMRAHKMGRDYLVDAASVEGLLARDRPVTPSSDPGSEVASRRFLTPPPGGTQRDVQLTRKRCQHELRDDDRRL